MQKATFDPGLTQKYAGPLSRVINEDGSFNVRRRGVRWEHVGPYLRLINMSWREFFFLVFLSYVATNVLFATGYFLLGPGQLQGADAPTEARRFLNDFFFSAQTLSTVGYGAIYPRGAKASTLAALESIAGLMGFALGTGLLFGRFSRASAKIGFSANILVTPYQDVTSLQFRIVNQRVNSLLELEAKLILMTVHSIAGELKREFQLLDLERDSIVFFPLTWTIVHPIGKQSPLYGKTAKDFEDMRAEFLILIKGFDDTFSQTVHARYSYRYEEIKWNARFAPAFSVGPTGEAIVDIDKVGALLPG